MIDFDRLLARAERRRIVEPKALFHGLVRGPEFEYLRDVQVDVLDAWHSRREHRDTVIKMNTGSGKTLVGLLTLQSCLNEGVGPALYVCPTNQLADQVVEQAVGCGIRTVQFGLDNQFPQEFLNREAILVTTFQKLFNGRSIFGVLGGAREPLNLGAVVIDDAHSCLRIAREEVTVRFVRGAGEAYERLSRLFQDVMEAQAVGTAASIRDGDPHAFMAIPYWAWQNVLSDVSRILAELRDARELRFSWNLVQDDLELCWCFITGTEIQITPYLVPIQRIPSFDLARRRFFLSATLIDDSILIREFGVAREAVENALHPNVSGDVGERLIIAPRIMDSSVDDDQVRQLVPRISSEGYNVVVLVPSFTAAKPWERVGAEVANNDTIDVILKQLRGSVGNFVVLVNRYDGIDLPGDACRLLVLDGLPPGGSLYAQYVMTARPQSRQLRSNQAQRIEQGLGRGVRSGGDYCAVLLLGSDLISFLTLVENREFLSPETRLQIEIGQTLAQEIRRGGSDPLLSIHRLIHQCLQQDPGWKKFHREMLSRVSYVASSDLPLKLAEMERKAVQLFRGGQAQGASDSVQKAIDDLPQLDPVDKGWYLQLAAQLLHKVDPGRAQEIQRKAHELNPRLFRPLEGVQYRRLMEKGTQASRAVEWLRGYDNANAVVVAVDEILAKLSFGVEPNEFEQALADLANLLGLQSQRPEKDYGSGPDVLWLLSDGAFFVIEAKNNVSLTRSTVSKDEVGQLANSINWFRQHYPGQSLTAIMVHPCSVCAHDAYPPEDAKVLAPEGLSNLQKRIRGFAAALAAKPPEAWTVQEVGTLLGAHELTPGGLRARLVPLRSQR